MNPMGRRIVIGIPTPAPSAPKLIPLDLPVGPSRELSARLDPEALAELEAARPHNRRDCRDGLRPCPFVGCRYSLYLDHRSRGIPKDVWWGRDPTEMAETCALDVADRGPHALEKVGQFYDVTRERVRQIEAGAIRSLRAGLLEAGYSLTDVGAFLGQLSGLGSFLSEAWAPLVPQDL